MYQTDTVHVVDVDVVREVNGRLVFGDAVARIAETLSPLGATARVVAEAGAVGVQLRRLSLEGKRLESERMQALAHLEDRRATVGATIKAMHRAIDGTERNAQRFRASIANMQREVVKKGVSIIEKEIYRDILSDLTAQLVTTHADGGNALTGHIHEVLNGEGALPPRSGNSNRPRQRSGQSSVQPLRDGAPAQRFGRSTRGRGRR